MGGISADKVIWDMREELKAAASKGHTETSVPVRVAAIQGTSPVVYEVREVHLVIEDGEPVFYLAAGRTGEDLSSEAEESLEETGWLY